MRSVSASKSRSCFRGTLGLHNYLARKHLQPSTGTFHVDYARYCRNVASSAAFLDVDRAYSMSTDRCHLAFFETSLVVNTHEIQKARLCPHLSTCTQLLLPLKGVQAGK